MTEKMIEDYDSGADEDLFEQARAKQEQAAPPAENQEAELPPVEVPPADDLEMARTLTAEMEDGFLIWDRSAEAEITITIEEAREILTNPTASGLLPTDKDIIRFLKLCQARGLNPYVGDAFLIGFDNYKSGKVSGATWQIVAAYQSYIKRAESHPEFDGMESGVTVWDRETNQKIDIEGDVYFKGDPDENGLCRFALIGGWARVHRKDKKVQEYATARLSSYKKTKPVYENGRKTEKVTATGYWSTDEPWMICKCARSKALKSAFPNELGGLQIPEEVGLAENVVRREEGNTRVRIGQQPTGSAADQL